MDNTQKIHIPPPPSSLDIPSVYVRGLPYSTTSDELSKHFSDLVPTRRAFIVRDKVTRESRGFGYVQFALLEDAQLAAEKLNGSMIGGRKVIVEVAAKASERPQAKMSVKRKRTSNDDEIGATDGILSITNALTKRKEEEEEGKELLSSPLLRTELSTLHLVPVAANRSTNLILFGLPTLGKGLLKTRLWKRVKKTTGAVKLEYPVSIEGSEKTTVALVTYSTSQARTKAIKALDSKSIHGHVLCAKPSEDYVNPKAAQTLCRIIVRNLRFDATALHLKLALKRHSPSLAALLTDIHIPLKEEIKGQILTKAEQELEDIAEKAKDEEEETEEEEGREEEEEEEEEGEEEEEEENNVLVKVNDTDKNVANISTSVKVVPQRKNRGFAFLQFAVKGAAEAAIAALNEKRVHKRTVAVDKVVSKEDFKASIAARSGNSKGSSESVIKEDTMVKSTTTDIDNDNVKNDDDDNEQEEEGNEINVVTKENDADKEKEQEDDKNEKEQEEEEEEEEEETVKAPIESPETLGSTLFLRNVAFDTDEKELIATFRSFGPVHYATIVRDRDSGRPKGTAFVKFYVKIGADRALAAASSPDEHMSDFRSKKENESHVESRRRETYADAVDKALLNDGGIKCGDRLLLVRRALSKEEASTLAAQKLAQTKSAPGKKLYDKRHTYLANEGHIRDGSIAAEHCPKADLIKREEARKTKKKKLESPLFFVSPTRLSIRNLARHVNDTTLRTLARDAAYAGVQSGLIDVTGKGEGDPALMPLPGTFLQPRVEVITARVLRESIEEAGGAGAGGRIARARLEPDGITARSKGFGFIEFSTHLHALACLRELNNNPAYSTSFAAGGATAKTRPEDEWPRLIVEFAIENIAKVKEHEKRKAEMKARRDALASAGVQQPRRESSGVGISGGSVQQQPTQQAKRLKSNEEEEKRTRTSLLTQKNNGQIEKGNKRVTEANLQSKDTLQSKQLNKVSSQAQQKHTQLEHHHQDQSVEVGTKRSRSDTGRAKPVNDDEAELDAILSGLDAVNWGEDKKDRKKRKGEVSIQEEDSIIFEKANKKKSDKDMKPRRKTSEKNDEEAHDKLVNEYKKKLFGL